MDSEKLKLALCPSSALPSRFHLLCRPSRSLHSVHFVRKLRVLSILCGERWVSVRG